MKLQVILSTCFLSKISANDNLFGADTGEDSGEQLFNITDMNRHMGTRRNMIYKLAEEGDSPLGVFSDENDKSNSQGRIYPRQLIKRHGCYCHYKGCRDGNTDRKCRLSFQPKLEDWRGVPILSDLDQQCFNMIKSHNCVRKEISECDDMRINYHWKFQGGNINCQNDKNDQCQQSLCTIDKEFAESVVGLVRSNPSIVSDWQSLETENQEEYDAICPKPDMGNIGTPFGDDGECCGLGLTRALYKRIPTMSQCCQQKDVEGNVVSESVTPLGMC